MPSFDHEFLADLFRENAELAAELLRCCAGIAVDHASATCGSIDFSQVASTTYYADAVTVLRDRDTQPIIGVVVEVQLQDDKRKLLTWPVYVTTLRANLACPVILLVVAPDPAIAAWARRPIDIGHPGFCLTPIVIELEDVPEVHDLDTASRLPQLAMLSVLAHPKLEIAEAGIAALAQLPEELARLYLDSIMDALPAEARALLEARMIKGHEYKSDFARKYYGQGREEGREEGLRAAVVTLARVKLGELSDADIAAIEATSDPCVLTGLITSLGQARSAAGARAALDRALVR